MVALSAVGHLVMLCFLLFRPSPALMSMPGVVAVELVAAPAAVPAPAPPKPAPVAVPPKPAPKQVVLPAQPSTPKPKPKAKPVKKPPPPPVERDYSDVLEQLRADAGETAPAPVPTPSPAPVVARTAPVPAAAGSRVGVPVPPEVAAWVKKAKIHVRRAWVLPPPFRTQALEAHVLVELDAGGNVIGKPDVVRSSGNPWYDEGVVRAIRKASPLPPPPAADEWAFVFVPGDSY
jgi:protein TonB